MSNGEVCCILGVCCPPGSAAQRHALEEMIQKSRPHMTAEAVRDAAGKVLMVYSNFQDCAPTIDGGATVGN